MNEPLKEAARLYAARDYQAAETVCRAIIRGDPRHFDALHLLGVLLTLQVRPEEAVPFLRRAEAVQPDHAPMLVNLGNALLAAKRYAEAVAVSRCGDAGVLNNLGLAYRGLEQHEAAEQAFRAATNARWDNVPAWFNLATTLVKLGRPEESLQAARTALRIAPLDTPVHRLAEVSSEMGQTLLALGRPEEALAECRRFLARHPEQKTVIWNMSLCLLLLGQLEEGWRGYEHRFDVPGHDDRPEGAIVLDPDQVGGKRVLILTEQGRGDMLQFVRYAPLLAERGAIVSVQAYHDLVPLIAAMPAVHSVVSTDAPRPEAEIITCVMSLPLAFGTQPANVPYLRVPPDREALWFGRLGPRNRPRIGVAWSGSTHSYERSAMPAEATAPLLALPGFEFHCLQKEITGNDQAWLEATQPPIIRHESQLADFADTAALISQMDGVVTIDTATAHLAGALAKPMSVMLPFNPDWRWGLGCAETLWYPTARLFRQPSRGAWSPVVQAVIRNLTGSG
ncbi:MAG: tetratricopeptide repeat protein [Rhodopila sp.]|nr:tetratricopeptide repeat protein [Rhodopila sp.]